MPELDISQPSAFESFLRWIGKPGYAVRNVLKGNLGGAVRNVVDIPLEAIDALIPGDVIPEISRKEDLPEFSDVIGGMEPGLAKTAVDIAGGIATDPLTYVGGPIIKAALGGATAGAKQVVKAAPSIGKAANNITRFTQRVSGAVPVNPEYQKILSEAENIKGISRTAGQSDLKEALSGLSNEDLEVMTQIVNNVKREGGLGKAGGQATTITTGRSPLGSNVMPDGTVNIDARMAPNVIGPLEGLEKVERGALDAGLPFNKAHKFGVAEQRVESILEGQNPAKVEGKIDATLRDEIYKAPQTSGPIDSRQVAGVAGTMPKGADDLAKASTTEWATLQGHKQELLKRLNALGLPAEQVARIEPKIDKFLQHAGNQFWEDVKHGVFEAPAGKVSGRDFPLYAMRQFSGLEDQLTTDILQKVGSPRASKARVLGSGEDVAAFLNAHPEVTMEPNLAITSAKRAAQQSEMLGRTTLAKGMVEKVANEAKDKLSKFGPKPGDMSTFDYYKAAHLGEHEVAALEAQGMPLYRPGESTDLASAANKIIKSMNATDPDTAYALKNVLQGTAPRGALMGVIAKANTLFKPYATAGAFIPKISFVVRNVVSGLGQVLSNPAARKQWPSYAKGMANDIVGAIDDGIEHLTGTRIGPDKFAEVNQAFREGGGTVEGVLSRIKDPEMREMVENGVITGGFVNSEQIADTIARSGWSKKWRDMRDWPAAIARGSEMRMRASIYKGLKDSGMSPQEAAKVISDTFFDYSIAGVENRAARDVIPFFQFTAKAIPQSAKLLKEQPWLMAGIRPLFSQGEDRPIYPYMQKGINVPLGADETGRQQYLTSLGLPIESLTQIPNPSGSPFDFLRDIRQGVVSQATPPLKALFAGVSGVDPYFGTPFASYEKPPELLSRVGMDAGDLARGYNVAASTGMIQPIASPIQTASGYLNPNESAGATILNTLTGVKLKNVDEARALQQLLEAELKTRPDVQQYTSLYKRSADPETKQLLDELKAIKQDVKKRRQSAAVNVP